MENTINVNYDLINRNYQESNTINIHNNSKLNGHNDQMQEVYLGIYDAEFYYYNDKNSDPQKSEFTFEAQLSNQKKRKDELEEFIYTQSYYNNEDFLEDENDEYLGKDDDDDDEY
jgi:hypothetical protein